MRRAVGTVTLQPQSFYEYAFNGAVYGDDTLFSEIRLLDCTAAHTIAGSGTRILGMPPATALAELGFGGAVAKVSEDLLGYFGMIRHCFGSDVCSALSGGYDSRLMLGLMRRNWIVPYLYVYGGEHSADVRVAKAIAAGEGLQLDHVDREQAPHMDPDAYRDLLEQQYVACDGMTSTGIFNTGQELATRLDRVTKARLQLNGGGGEIYRNFWVLGSRSYTTHQFLTSKYDRFDYSPFGNAFSKSSYFDTLADKVRICAKSNGHRLTPRQVAMLYVTFRLRYWMGMNNSHNNQFAYSLTPFGEAGLAEDSYSLPVSWKNEGRFEANLIRVVDGALAAYP
jgi:asparagine synthase (glutamine-hydrolysing)